ncbi:MAG: bifunctional transaldolase/phosoglucose isomerase [Deltaproteobacteria bacterium]|nr:bifunctional transaldolase/phosoglucose isomerase [Deltaproteobacteria bacterium]
MWPNLNFAFPNVNLAAAGCPLLRPCSAPGARSAHSDRGGASEAADVVICRVVQTLTILNCLNVWNVLNAEPVQAVQVVQIVQPVGLNTSAVVQSRDALFFGQMLLIFVSARSKRERPLVGELASQAYALGAAGAEVQAGLDEWREQGKVRRLWQGDRSLWTGADEDQWLGWLHALERQRDHPENLQHLAEDVRQAGIKRALLLGMGGSSLCPELMAETFGPASDFPRLLVLDSTVPAQVKDFERQIDLKDTLFIVSSKSGGTTETRVLEQYFFARAEALFGKDRAGSRFIAITDPGTKLHKQAESNRFRHVVHGEPDIGGRYSALSNFGMAPAAIMGVNVPNFLDRAEIMVRSCASSVPPEANPAVVLGVILGTLGRRGVDKVTFVTSPAIAALSRWLEQLVAESTGKRGKGLVPIAGEEVGPPGVYGKDRLFVYLRLNGGSSVEHDRAVAALEKAGHPVVRIHLEETMNLGQEFFRWEMATAVAGSVLGINPFDQPDVEASKAATRKLAEDYERTGRLPEEVPLASEEGLSLHVDPQNGAAVAPARAKGLEAVLAAHLGRIRPGDYFAINAYVARNPANRKELEAIRHAVRDAKRVATTLGFGPRFLHSTGQLHKGGPDSGVFLQVTADDAEDLPIPGQKYTFGVLKRFQAQGDFAVLAERGRRLLRVHLGPEVSSGLGRLGEIVRGALS